jgi:RNA polymerase sigma-70 factor (ECF subfamily)
MNAELSDEMLLRAYCSGDEDAFDLLFRRFAPRVHATAFRLTSSWEDADDTMQEVFVRLARKASTIRRGSALPSWIYRTTVNRSMDCLRRRRRTISLDAPETPAARVIAFDSVRREAERERSRRRDELLERIEGLIPRLPERQSAVFVLRSFQGLSHREIADALECSEASCRSHYSLACRKMREWCARVEAKEALAAGPEGARPS